MKRLIIALMLLLIGGGMCMTQAQTTDTKVDKKAEKAAKKAAEEAELSAKYALAVKALEAQDFVLEATRVEFKRGRSEYVSSTTNFVSLKDGKATVQLATNSVISGPNGMGGITVEGNASNIE